ncbi:MAG TPA: glycosyltransferase family 39 protein [Anaeromyxobacteraceae bacterium]|nr:glycosyltransferase family 39 protein [Anaeromyxobacteraceae bacterium]
MSSRLSRPWERAFPRVAPALATVAAAFAFLYCAYVAIRYSGQRLLDMHSFRQTQTALTAFWACHDGFRLDYETPVGGAPWSMPFEFPLYQYLVALLSCRTGFGLERVGRLLSFAFLAACALPAARIARSLYGRSWWEHFAVFSALFFSAPLYVYWGRAFLMETAALFFSLCFVSYAISICQGEHSGRTAALAGVSLTLAILQKSTTALPLLLVFGLAISLRAIRDLRAQGVRSSGPWFGILAVAVPFLLGAGWARFADAVRERNPLGHYLTSKALLAWNFGSARSRVEWRLWDDVIWQRTTVANAGGWLGLATMVAGLVLLDAKHRKSIVVGVLLFLLYFMVFENLHFVHDYYQVANGVYLLFSVAIALGGILVHRNRILGGTAALALLALLVGNVRAFRAGGNYREMLVRHEGNDPVLAAAAFVDRNTDSARPIVVFGDDWHSELPFFSKRKAFVVPHFFPEYDDVLRNPARYVGEGPSAMLVCREDRKPEVELKIESSFKPSAVQRLDLCDVFLR